MDRKIGAPKFFISDQGRQYIAAAFKNNLLKHNIKHICTTPYNPTGNSVSERKNSVILQV